MPIIGLTGQSGAGKGLFCSVCREFDGVYALDTDKTARLVVEKGKPALKELCGYFGEQILHDDGTLNRPLLASIAFSDSEKHEKLNQITHFYILKEIEAWLARMKENGARAMIIDAPLLFESGADALCDVTVGITAPYETRLARIMERDGIDEESAKRRLDCQMPESFFAQKCTYILSNDGTGEEFCEKAKELICKILSDHK